MPMQLHDSYYMFHKVGGHLIRFELSDEKEKAGDSTVLYYGWLAANGAWLIVENDTTAGSYRFVGGASGYAANWAAREGKSYDYYSNLVIGE